MANDDVKLRFNVYGKIDQEALHWMANMRRQYAALAEEIYLRISSSREMSLALTKLEEAMFWTNAAVARGLGEPSGYGHAVAVDGPPDPTPISSSGVTRG